MASTPPSPMVHRLLRALAAAAAMGFLFLMLMETGLRVVKPPQVSYLPRRFDPAMGQVYTTTPGTWHKGGCYRVRSVRFNPQGFRDDPWTPQADGPRLAVLGDSFMEGVQVNDGEVFADLLEQRTGAQVLNLGQGGTGTGYAIAAYDRVARKFQPDGVLLGFFLMNDVYDDWTLRQAVQEGRISGFSQAVVSGSRTVVLDPAPGGRRLAPFIRHVYLLRLARTVALPLVQGGGGGPVDAWHGGHASLGVYRRPDETWTQAWDNQRLLLRDLKRRTAKDGAWLAVMTVPGVYEQAPDPKAVLSSLTGRDAPADFDPGAAQAQLRTLLRKEDIPLMDLVPAFRNAPEDMDGATPRYAFPCDGHWNKEGHALAAGEAAAWLTRERLLPAPSH